MQIKVVEPGASTEAPYTIERRKFALRPVTNGVSGKTGSAPPPSTETL